MVDDAPPGRLAMRVGRHGDPAVQAPPGGAKGGSGPTGPWAGRAPWLAAVVLVITGVVVAWSLAGTDATVRIAAPGGEVTVADGVPASTPTARWRVTVDGDRLDGLAVVDGRVITLSTTVDAAEGGGATPAPTPTHRSIVTAIETATGAPAWTSAFEWRPDLPIGMWTPGQPAGMTAAAIRDWRYPPPLVHVVAGSRIVTLASPGGGSAELQQVALDAADGSTRWRRGDDDAERTTATGWLARPGRVAATLLAGDATTTTTMVDLATGTAILTTDGAAWAVPGTSTYARRTADGAAVLADADDRVVRAVEGSVVGLGDVLVMAGADGLVGVDGAGGRRWRVPVPPVDGTVRWALAPLGDRVLAVRHAGGGPDWAATVGEDGAVAVLDASGLPGPDAITVVGPGPASLVCAADDGRTGCPAPLALVDLDGTVRATADRRLHGRPPAGPVVPGGGVATQLGLLGIEAAADSTTDLVLRSWRDLDHVWRVGLDAAASRDALVASGSDGVAVGATTPADDGGPDGARVWWLS